MDDVLQGLIARLPELEWRLAEVGFIPDQRLPRGLFQCVRDGGSLVPMDYVSEVKRDLDALGRAQGGPSACFLADQVSRKINVLLQICQLSRKKKIDPVRASFGVRSISTRQQWLGQLHEKIERLMVQQRALRTTLETNASMRSPEVTLGLQRELGEITRHLVTAQETLLAASADQGRNYQ